VATDGATRAGRGLSGLMGQEIAIHVPNIRVGTRDDACDAIGGAETVVLGSYVAIVGDLTGHVMLLFPESRALECVDLMVGQPPGTTSEADEMACSAISELGNIVGSAFVNALADHLNLILHPSPPQVLHDMANALVEAVYAEVLSQGGDVVMMDAIFEDQKGQAAGLLIVAPDPASLGVFQRVAA
jgi:chemotaxis protein CheC